MTPVDVPVLITESQPTLYIVITITGTELVDKVLMLKTHIQEPFASDLGWDTSYPD